MAVFDRWAEYYDLIHDGLPGDTEFYVNQAVQSGGPVLELGVGTGRIAIPMIRAGVHVTGIDNSAAMLALCREKLREIGPAKGRLDLVRADMTEFALRARFACIAMPYRTFMHLLTPEDQRRCLAAVRRHLAPGGVFVLNTWAPNAATLRALSRARWNAKRRLAGEYSSDDLNITIRHWHATRVDAPRHTLTEVHWIQEVDAAGIIQREVTIPLVRVWAVPKEMERLLCSSRFAVRALYGDFGGTPFTADSTEMIWVLSASRGR